MHTVRLPIALSLVALALLGCIGRRVGPVTVHRGQSGGVSYEVRGGGSALETRSESGDVAVAMGAVRTLEIRAKRVYVYGHDYGAVTDGDALILDDHGQLFVNMKLRVPIPK
jgi:hypothetical protein